LISRAGNTVSLNVTVPFYIVSGNSGIFIKVENLIVISPAKSIFEIRASGNEVYLKIFTYPRVELNEEVKGVEQLNIILNL
jgi:hypothetical protein